jgi:hypothetical protein
LHIRHNARKSLGFSLLTSRSKKEAAMPARFTFPSILSTGAEAAALRNANNSRRLEAAVGAADKFVCQAVRR